MLIDRNDNVYMSAEEWVYTWTVSELPQLLRQFKDCDSDKEAAALKRFEKAYTQKGLSFAVIGLLLNISSSITKNPEAWGLKNISVGDIVKIVDMGKIYPSYEEFFEENELALTMPPRWKEGHIVTDKKVLFKVLYIGSHSLRQETKIAIIEQIKDKSIYLIDIRGLEKLNEKDI